MDSISVIKAAKHPRNVPYPRSVRAVVALKKKIDNVMHVALCDKTDYIKLICYEESFFSKFIDGATVIVRNFVKGNTTLFVKKNGRISQAQPMAGIPQALLEKARNLVEPPVAPVMPIGQIEVSSTTEPTIVSVKGKIMKVINAY